MTLATFRRMVHEPNYIVRVWFGPHEFVQQRFSEIELEQAVIPLDLIKARVKHALLAELGQDEGTRRWTLAEPALLRALRKGGVT